MHSAKKSSNKTNVGLEEKLWMAADKMRGHMDAAEYKHVVLGLIFLKYISDAFEEHYNKLQMESNTEAEERQNYQTENIFWVPVQARWLYLQVNANNPKIGQIIDDAMSLLEKENLTLKGVLPKDYANSSFDKQRLGELINLVSTIALGDVESRSKDILGRVYEYFLGRFASIEGRGGEFYTPQSIVKLLVAMVEPFKGLVYDPCCGSGGMFVQSKKFVLAHGGSIGDLSIYGQELNQTTWRLCKMNLAIRGIEGNIGNKNADTFHSDMHKTLKANYIIANPPFNTSDWGGERLRKDERWVYGSPPIGNANAAWIQHILYHLAPSGIAGLVLTNGSLSVGQKEGEIRKAVIEADRVDCIISLPVQLFYNTQIAVCLWLLAQDKKDSKFRDRTGHTLFIYAHEFGKVVDRTHRELTDNEIERIASTYHSWRSEDSTEYKDIPGFCKSATINEIKSHNWTLVPGRYVGFDNSELPDWDISRLREEFAHAEVRLSEVSKASESALTILKEMLYG